MAARANLHTACLYGIMDLAYVNVADVERVTGEMIEGGIDLLQLRGKDQTIDAIEEVARRLHRITSAANVPFLINDHPRIAAALNCEGVHVGQDDDPIGKVREIVGASMIVGKSTHSLEQAEAAEIEGADYIGFGPLFATPTKAGRAPIGLDSVAEVHRRVTLPIFCIGGVKIENLSLIVAAGARRVVIVSAILQSGRVADYVRNARQKLPAL